MFVGPQVRNQVKHNKLCMKLCTWLSHCCSFGVLFNKWILSEEWSFSYTVVFRPHSSKFISKLINIDYHQWGLGKYSCNEVCSYLGLSFFDQTRLFCILILNEFNKSLQWFRWRWCWGRRMGSQGMSGRCWACKAC